MGVISKSDMKWASKVWAMQKKHPKKRFTTKDFTNSGKLTKKGLIKVRK